MRSTAVALFLAACILGGLRVHHSIQALQQPTGTPGQVLPHTLSPDACVAVFMGDGVDDLTRLLVNATRSSIPQGLVLADLIYTQGANHDADFVALWTLSADPNLSSSPALSRTAPNQDLGALADSLQNGRLHNKTFALGKIHGTWSGWSFQLSSSGSVTARGAEGQSLASKVSALTAPILNFATSNASFPLGFGKTTDTSWIPYFAQDRVIFRIQHNTDLTDTSTPDTSALANHSGYILGDGYMNFILSNDLKSRQWQATFNGQTYNLINASFSDTDGFLNVTLDIKEKPGAHLTAHLAGPDLAVQSVGASVDPTAPDYTILQSTMNTIADALTIQLQSSGTTIRPKGFLPLGTFPVGTYLLNGGMLVSSVVPGDHTLVISGPSRINPGDVL